MRLTRCLVGIGLVAGLLTACAVQDDSAVSAEHDEHTLASQSALGSCPGRPPPPKVCNDVVCHAADQAWEYEPLPVGTPCGSTGHCNAAGTCVVPTPPPSPQPIVPPPRDLTVGSVPPHQNILHYTCGANATFHQIYRKDNDLAFQPLFQPTEGCPAGHWYELDDYIIPGHRYCYYILDYNPAYQAQSETVCTQAGDDTTVPTAPTGHVDAVIHGGKVTFHDESNSEDGYRVYLRPVGGAWQLQHTFLNPNPAVHAKNETYGNPGTDFVWTVNGLSDTTSYEFKVEVFHDHAPLSAEVSFPAFLPLPDLPTAPMLAVTSKTTHSISLGWHGATRQDDFTLNGVHYPPTASTAVMDGLAPSSSYCFVVDANNRAGSTRSNQVCAMTDAPPAGPHTAGLILRPPVNPPSGLVLNGAILGPIAGGFLDSLELPRANNDLRLTGLVLVPPGSSNAACTQPGSILLQVGHSISGNDLKTLYKTARPSLASGLGISGCPVWSSQPANSPVVLINAHYTAPN